MSGILLTGCFVKEPVVLDKPAPDFTAEAFYRGDRINIKLSNN